MPQPGMEKPEIREKGADVDGRPQYVDRRLFMQLLVFGHCADATLPARVLEEGSIVGAVYEDIHDPRGIGMLVLHEDPAFFLTTWRTTLHREPFASLTLKSEYTMFGRTYAVGYEPDLEAALLTRPRVTVLNPAWPWAIWYPLRRRGNFALLSSGEQRSVLMEHGAIGRSYGEADHAHDVRLACHGLDKDDNDFVIGLTGRQLHPLSAVVQTMRQTKQTSMYIQRLGPFFVGRAVWKSSL